MKINIIDPHKFSNLILMIECEEVIKLYIHFLMTYRYLSLTNRNSKYICSSSIEQTVILIYVID